MKNDLKFKIKWRFETHGIILQDNLVQEGRNGIENSHVDAIGVQKQHVGWIQAQSLDGLQEVDAFFFADGLSLGQRRRSWWCVFEEEQDDDQEDGSHHSHGDVHGVEVRGEGFFIPWDYHGWEEESQSYSQLF